MSADQPPAGPFRLAWLPAVPKRFPWVMAISLAGAWAGVALSHSAPDGPALGLSHAQAAHLLKTAYLGIGLLFSLAMMGERADVGGRGAWTRHLSQAGGVALLLGYFFCLGEEPVPGSRLRFGMLFVAVHLLVAFAPFLRDSRPRAFWQYNQALFLRIIASLVFSGFVGLGLSMAMWVLRTMLGLDIPKAAYADLRYLIAGLFNTWFFLAGVPGDFSSLEKQDRYPLSLKILSQYVCIPLVSLNVLILYAYMVKILAEAVRGGEWPAVPDAWIGRPFLAAGLCGILSLSLLHPAHGEEERPWTKVFSRWFYPLQWPPMIFLVAVRGQDVFREGLRVDAYLDLVLAFWIAGIAVYFTFGKGKSIKAIPVSLFLLCTFCSFGPWGVIGLPRFDQVRRLETLMADNGLFRDGRFLPAAPGHLPFEPDRMRIMGTLRFLEGYGGLGVLRDRLPPGGNANVLKDNLQLAEFLGLYQSYKRTPTPQTKPEICRGFGFYSSDYSGGRKIVDIRGYSFLFEKLEIRGCGAGARLVDCDGFRGKRKTDKVVFRCRDNTAILSLGGRTLSIPLENAMIGLEKKTSGTGKCYATPGDSVLLAQGSNGRMRAAMQMSHFAWEMDSSHRRLQALEFNLLFSYE